MDFAPSEEEKAVRDLARQILGDLATDERLAALEKAGEPYDRALWKALAEAELLGVDLPEAEGGSQLGFVALCLLIEEAGRRAAAVPLVETLAMGALPVARFGTSAQTAEILPPVARGERILTAAMTELGTDVGEAPFAHAYRTPHGWEIHGEKPAVAYADEAWRVLVPASTDHGVGVFLVDPRAKGVTLKPQEATHDATVFEVSLDGVVVTDEGMLGDESSGAEILRWTCERAHTALSAYALGLADTVLAMTARYTSEREQFGRPIGTFQAVSQRAGDAYVDVMAMRLTVQQAAWRLSQELPASEAVEIARFHAAEGSHRVTHAASHLHGGMGFDRDYPLFRYFLKAKWLEMLIGGAHAHLAALGRRIAHH